MARKSDTTKKPAANAMGEAKLRLSDDRTIRLKLTLGAMAKLEDDFGVESFEEIMTKLGSTKAIAKFLHAMAVAAGEDITVEEIRSADVDLAELRDAIKAAAGVVLGGEDEPKNAEAPSR